MTDKALAAATNKPFLAQSEMTHIPPSERPPATKAEGTAQLASCLVLVAPSGMTASERQDWLNVARQTLSGIPADLLARGCEKARRTCKFASEIVPTILAEVEGEWTRRKRLIAEREAFERNRHAPRLASPELVDPAEVRKLIQSIGKAA